MSNTNLQPEYALGNSDAEHRRLIWQAEQIAPLTERLFREAGISSGHRVLDVGSGVGDVAILVSRLVGPSGEVVGVERESRSILRARARVEKAEIRNVRFIQSDITEITEAEPFDAVVGRFILMWLPDPVRVLRSLSRLVRSGGIIAFQEPYWAPVLLLLKPLPLWFAVISLIHETFRGFGANYELGSALYKVFQDAGLPGPTMRQEIPMGRSPEITRWFADTLSSLLPRIRELRLPIESVGNLDTLAARLHDELETSELVAAAMAPVGAWARK